MKGENGLVYHVSNKLLPWLDAREECEKRTGKLVSIGNEKSNDFVKSILKEQKPSLFWTGKKSKSDLQISTDECK